MIFSPLSENPDRSKGVLRSTDEPHVFRLESDGFGAHGELVRFQVNDEGARGAHLRRGELLREGPADGVDGSPPRMSEPDHGADGPRVPASLGARQRGRDGGGRGGGAAALLPGGRRGARGLRRRGRGSGRRSGCGGGVLGGIALAQWLLLRQRVSWAARWPAALAAAGAAAAATGFAADEALGLAGYPEPPAVPAVVGLTAFALAHWLVLRRCAPGSRPVGRRQRRRFRPGRSRHRGGGHGQRVRGGESVVRSVVRSGVRMDHRTGAWADRANHVVAPPAPSGGPPGTDGARGGVARSSVAGATRPPGRHPVLTP